MARPATCSCHTETILFSFTKMKDSGDLQQMTDLPIYQESLFFGWGEPPHNIDWVPLRAPVVVALASALQVAQSAVVHLEGHRKLMTLVKILHSKGRLPKGLGEFLGILCFYGI